MSRRIRKTGVIAMSLILAAVLSGCSLAKKDEDGTAKKTLYGAYAIVGKSLQAPDIPDPELEGITVGQKDKKGFVHFKKIKGYFFFNKYDQKENTISMDGDPQLTHFSGSSNMKDGETPTDKWQKTGQSCKATLYVQETKGITKVQIGSVYKRADGTFYLEPAGMSCVQDLCKTGGAGISESFSVDTEDGKMTYGVHFKADRAVKKIQIIEINKDDRKIKKTAWISPKMKQYQMQKDTAYVIINEQLIGMKGQTINRQKIHSAKKNFTYEWKQLGDDGVLTPTGLKFKK